MKLLLIFSAIVIVILLTDGTGAINSQYPSQYGNLGGSSNPYNKGYSGSSGYPGSANSQYNSGYPGSASSQYNSGYPGSANSQYNSGNSGNYMGSPFGQSSYNGGYDNNPANNESPYGDFGIRHQIDDGYPNWYPNNDDGIPYGDGYPYPYFTYDRPTARSK